jgi:hypothetical protein
LVHELNGGKVACIFKVVLFILNLNISSVLSVVLDSMVSSGLVINESHVEVVIVEHVGGNGITGSISVLCFVMSVGEESSNTAKDGDDDDDDDDGGASSGFDSGGITSK